MAEHNARETPDLHQDDSISSEDDPEHKVRQSWEYKQVPVPSCIGDDGRESE